jgi:glycine C-acetyltransferase
MNRDFKEYIKGRLSAQENEFQNRLIHKDESLNFSSSDYLGLSASKEIEEQTNRLMERYNLGLSSMFYGSGTHEIHNTLAQRISKLFGTEDTLIYAADGSLFEPLFSQEDAIITDELTHINLTGNIRFCNAARYTYKHSNMRDLESQLMLSQAQRFRIIATDGLFAVDGDIARLEEICSLAERYNALVLVDESHSAGVIGHNGRGSAEHCNVMEKVDLFTGTFDKAMGGTTGGYISGDKEIIEFLRKQAQPYLLLNTLPTAQCCTTIATLDYIENHSEARETLWENCSYFREQLRGAGFKLKQSGPTICTIMTFDTLLTRALISLLENEGIYARSFCYPIVPKGQARIRFQLSSQHSRKQLDRALLSIIEHGRAAGII